MPSNNLALPRLSMLSTEHCETIHRASLEILRRTGVRVFHKEALELLRGTDATISDNDLVRFPPGLVEWALAQAPSRVALSRRGTAEVVAPLEGRRVHFGTDRTAPTTLTRARVNGGGSRPRM